MCTYIFGCSIAVASYPNKYILYTILIHTLITSWQIRNPIWAHQYHVIIFYCRYFHSILSAFYYILLSFVASVHFPENLSRKMASLFAKRWKNKAHTYIHMIQQIDSDFLLNCLFHWDADFYLLFLYLFSPSYYGCYYLNAATTLSAYMRTEDFDQKLYVEAHLREPKKKIIWKVALNVTRENNTVLPSFSLLPSSLSLSLSLSLSSDVSMFSREQDEWT